MKAIDIISKLKIDHFAFLCEDITKSNYYSFHTSLGWIIEHEEEIPSEGTKAIILSSKNESFLIELIMPLGVDSKLVKTLKSRGEGFHHICHKTDKISETLAELDSLGIIPLPNYPRIGSRGKKIAFFHPKDFNGLLIELAETL